MTLTPLDIQNTEFKSSFRGYSQSDVDSFLNKILVDYEKIYKDNQKIKEEQKRIEDELSKYKNIEDNLSAALVVAQKTAEDLKENAQKEASLIIKEAELAAEKIVEEAQRKVYQKEEELARLINQYNSYRLKVLSFVESQYEMIKAEQIENHINEVAVSNENHTTNEEKNNDNNCGNLD